jgi:CheY-like chemotaxis protein
MARILIVDDDPNLRDVVKLILAGPENEIDSVADGQAALERLAQQAYDLVVCDLSMSGLDGRAVYHVIERQPPPRPAMLFLKPFDISPATPPPDRTRTSSEPRTRRW